MIILLCNSIGMIPHALTITSSLIVTFYLAFMFFGGANLIGIYTHKWKFLSIFAPKSVPIAIIPFLTLVELVSYTSRVISLAVRLFANMMAGHTLLKILISFFWILLILLKNVIPFVELSIESLPFSIITAVTFLESAFLHSYNYAKYFTFFR